MKPIPLIFAIVSCGALSMRLAFAGEPTRVPANSGLAVKHLAGDRTAGEMQDRRAAGKKGQTGTIHANFSQPGHPSKINSPSASVEGQPKRSAAIISHQPASNKIAAVPGNELMMNKTSSHGENLAGSPLGNGFALPSPGMVRGRAAKPDLLGGLAASSAKTSAAAINGSAMKRKP
jgi:hypothetical protein